MHAAIRKLGVPIIIGGLVLSLTVIASVQLKSASRRHLEASLQSDADQVANHLQQSLNACSRLLRGVQSAYASMPNTGVVLFSHYAPGLFADSGCTGSTSLSFAPMILPEQRDSFIQAQHQAGNQDFTIRPSGNRSLYAPVLFSAASVGALAIPSGTDLFTEPAEQAILAGSRDSGVAMLSGKVLVGGTDNLKIPGFALAAPLFAMGSPHAGMDERRSNLMGWAILTLSASDWVHAATGENAPKLDISILAGKDDTEDARIFSTSAWKSDKADLQQSRTLRLNDQNWFVTLTPTADYLESHRLSPPALTGLFGLALTILVGGLYIALQRRQENVRAKTEAMEAALQESDERWRFALEGGDDGVWSWNVSTRQVEYSPRCDAILGVPTNGAVTARIHADDKAPERAAMQACLDGRSPLYISEHRMLGEDGKWRWISTRGMVVARTPDGQPQRMIGTLTDITERRTAAERLSTLGQHDELTGLPNRTLFFNVLQHTLNVAKRNKALLALLYVDVDRLKAINDSFGRMTANKLLREVGEVLRKSVRDSDVVGHFGGDDFVILLPSISNEADVRIVTNKIREAMNRDFAISNRHINVTVSIGVMIFPLHARTAESMVNSAMRAVRAAKAAGRNAVHIGAPPAQPATQPDEQAARRRRIAS